MEIFYSPSDKNKLYNHLNLDTKLIDNKTASTSITRRKRNTIRFTNQLNFLHRVIVEEIKVNECFLLYTSSVVMLVSRGFIVLASVWYYTRFIFGIIWGGLWRETVQVLLASSAATKDTWDPLSNRCVRSGEETEREIHHTIYHHKPLFV